MGEVRKFQEKAERIHGGSRSLSALVIRIPIQGIPKWTVRFVRERCPQSQRRGILHLLHHMMEVQEAERKLPDTPVWLL